MYNNKFQSNKKSSPGGPPFGRNPRRETDQKDSEFDQNLLDVARVARVTAGGRRFSFRTVVIVGDRAGRVGVGISKGKNVQIAMVKATRNAKKNIINVPITKEGTLPHEAYGKSSSAVVFVKPAPPGRGIIAGGAVRVICDLAGYKDVIGKMISRTNNKLNNARATIEALKSIKQVKQEQTEVKTENKKSKSIIKISRRETSKKSKTPKTSETSKKE